MHKNAIKEVRGVNFYGIWVKNTVIFPRFWTFSLVIFVIFWLNTRDFQEKSFGNTDKNYLRVQKGSMNNVIDSSTITTSNLNILHGLTLTDPMIT